MNPYDAIRLHWEWRVQLRLLVTGHGGPFDTSTVGRDDVCDLGMWIRGEGAKHAALPSLAHLKSAHAAFHEAAAEVVKKVSDGDRDGAKALLEPGSSFDHASNATVLAILRLASDLESA